MPAARSSVSRMAAIPHLSPSDGYNLHSGPNLAAHRGLASLAPGYGRDQHGDWNRHSDGNRRGDRYSDGNWGGNGFYHHHPWGYLSNASSIYPYSYGQALGSGFYGSGCYGNGCYGNGCYGSGCYGNGGYGNGGYGYGGYGYGGYGVPAYNVYNDYVYNDYQTPSGPPAASYNVSYPPAAENPPEAVPPPPVPEGDTAFYAQALAAFSAGKYEEAIRLADHALVDVPKDARTHELLSLAMFALGDYRGAAIEAHAAISLGPIGNWARLHADYNNPDTYRTQLRALEGYVTSHPKAANAHFLLGYQYLMLGHADAAKYQFQTARRLTPDDALAAKLAE